MSKKDTGRPRSEPFPLSPTRMDFEQRKQALLSTIEYSDLTDSAQATIEGTAILEAQLLDEILKVLRRINAHVAIVADEEV